jgi:hypothetical protein
MTHIDYTRIDFDHPRWVCTCHRQTYMMSRLILTTLIGLSVRPVTYEPSHISCSDAACGEWQDIVHGEWQDTYSYTAHDLDPGAHRTSHTAHAYQSKRCHFYLVLVHRVNKFDPFAKMC